MATAGFSITTKGCKRTPAPSNADNAIPLKKPATPIPSGTHIFSKREDTKTINDNTGIAVRKEYPAKDIRVCASNVPCGKSLIALLQDRVCSILLSLSMMADTKQRIDLVNGETERVYRAEYQYHYETALKNTLRLLGVLIGHVELTSQSRIENILHNGYEGFQKLIEDFEDAFEAETARPSA